MVDEKIGSRDFREPILFENTATGVSARRLGTHNRKKAYMSRLLLQSMSEHNESLYPNARVVETKGNGLEKSYAITIK